jgi:nucleoside 2-deoxyribosyltransferase
MKVYLGRAVSGEIGPRSLEAVQLAHRALVASGAGILCERVADPDYRPGLDRPELIAEMMRRELLEADAGCMEMTGRSTGVGFEAGWLAGRGRPVLILHDADVAASSSIVRFPPFDHCIAFAYRDLMEISEAVKDFVNTIAAHVAYRAKG